MTLIVILNAVLAILIVSTIVALHSRAIFADRRERPRGAVLLSSAERPIHPVAPYAPQPTAALASDRQERAAA
jgi:hypothetical protein